MIFYRLSIAPSESDGEGEDHDKWFASLEEARRWRTLLIKEDPHLTGHRYGEDFRITKVTMRSLPPKALLLAALNRCAAESEEEMVPQYVPKRPKHFNYNAPWGDQIEED